MPPTDATVAGVATTAPGPLPADECRPYSKQCSAAGNEPCLTDST